MKGIVVLVAALGIILFVSPLAVAEVLYSFDTSIEDWTAEDWGYSVPTLGWTSWSGGALEANTSTVVVNTDNWAKFYLKEGVPEDRNLTSNPSYSVDIWIPDNFYFGKAKLGIRTGDGWDLHMGDEVELVNNSWQTINWDFTGVSGLGNVRELGLEIGGFMPESTAFNIDNVTISAVPEVSSAVFLLTGLFGLVVVSRRS